MFHAGYGFWSWQLIVALALNGAVQALGIAAYAARLAGLTSGRVGTAISLYNLFSTTSRFASMIYTPMLGALSDAAFRSGGSETFSWQLRTVLIAGAGGAVVGALALPAFVVLYLRMIRGFERTHSVLRAARRLFNPRTLAGVIRDLRTARLGNVLLFSMRSLPREVLVLNTVVTAVYSVGIVAAAYASVLEPGAARTALLLSGVVNGIGAIAFNVVVDPAAAFITDQAARNERPAADVRALVTYLSLTAIAGFLLAQLLLWPAATMLAYVAALLSAGPH